MYQGRFLSRQKWVLSGNEFVEKAKADKLAFPRGVCSARQGCDGLQMYWAGWLVRPESGKGGSGKEWAMHLVRGGRTGTSGNEINYQLLLSIPGTCLVVKVKLNLRVCRVIRRTRVIMRGTFELLVDKTAMAPWLLQWRQIHLLAQRGAHTMQTSVVFPRVIKYPNKQI